MSEQSMEGAQAACRKAMAIYEKAAAPARAEYAKALKAYDKARSDCEMAKATYNKATAPALAAYRAAIAKALEAGE